MIENDFIIPNFCFTESALQDEIKGTDFLERETIMFLINLPLNH